MGVYGGLFDPVHDGHLEVARYARTALELDKVLLVPCKLPNHRSGAQASGAARLHMLELASRDEATLEVSDIELEREGVSYTVDTLAQLRKQEPNTDFVFILGQDAFSSLPQWQRWHHCHAPFWALQVPGLVVWQSFRQIPLPTPHGTEGQRTSLARHAACSAG